MILSSFKLYALIGLAVYFGLLLFFVLKDKSSKNSEDYFLGGRSLPFWALSITFIASWWGAGSAISTADEAFSDGMGAYWIFGMPVVFSTILLAVFAKAIRRIPAITQPEMMRMRYGKYAERIMSFLIFSFMTLTAASQMVGVGMFFSSFLDIDYSWAVIIGTLVVLIYSCFGGFKGVVISDIIQFGFLLIASLIVFFVAWKHAGGWGPIVEHTIKTGHSQNLSFTNKLSQNIMYVITFGTAWMIQANGWQRLMATRNTKDARKMSMYSLFAFIPLYMIVVLTGMAASVMFTDLPPNGVIPALITEYMSPLLSALVFIGLASAIMSTMDSLINTGAMVLTQDVYLRYLVPNSSASKTMNVAKLSTVIVTFIAIVVALKIQSILQVSWIAADIISTGCFVPLVLGFIWKRGNQIGAVSSMIFGTIFSLYHLAIQLGATLPLGWKQGSSLQVIIGISGSFVIYVLGSFLTQKEPNEKALKYIRTAKLISVVDPK